MADPPKPTRHEAVKAAWATLAQEVQAQRPAEDLTVLERAFLRAEWRHGNQQRRTGEPYITHPLAVATYVASLGMDMDSIVAAVLHDLLEDTDETAEDIQAAFGEDVLRLVEGVTKLKLNIQPDANDRERKVAESTRAAETLRKMLLAMAQDIRVMVIKLADRLHNMKTLNALQPEKRTRIANETLDIYAPLAARLGIWQIKWQLEDLAFQVLHPEEYERISHLVAKSRTQREGELKETIDLLRSRLDDRGLADAKIMGRPKHLYSIYNKLVKQGVPFEEIYDLIALRIICTSNDQCYPILGLVHELWMPMPGLFYDYVNMPKPNGYQSLHTKVIGPGREPLEIQIRTKLMHEIAEFGVAAHWNYKEGSSAKVSTESRLSNLRRQLFDWSSDTTSTNDFLIGASTELFSEQVFAFTPKGDVIDMPADSTPIDFAFRVHTTLGYTVVGAKINRMIAPLSTKIKNGDVVELITRSNAQPSLDWLEFVKSPHTRNKLRGYFRRRNRSENATRGKEAIEKELRSLGLDPRLYLGEDKMNEIAKDIRDCETGLDVFARVGEGLSTVQSTVGRLRGLVKEPVVDSIPVVKPQRAEPTVISSGIDNVMLKRAKCCMPIPEEEVIGYVTRGRGIMLHRKVCPNAMALMDSEGERIIPIRWTSDGTLYSVSLKIVAFDRQGLLADVSTIFGESKTNVVEARVKGLPNHTAEIDVTLHIRDTDHLKDVMNKISNFADVISILRLFGRVAKN